MKDISEYIESIFDGFMINSTTSVFLNDGVYVINIRIHDFVYDFKMFSDFIEDAAIEILESYVPNIKYKIIVTETKHNKI